MRQRVFVVFLFLTLLLFFLFFWHTQCSITLTWGGIWTRHQLYVIGNEKCNHFLSITLPAGLHLLNALHAADNPQNSKNKNKKKLQPHIQMYSTVRSALALWYWHCLYISYIPLCRMSDFALHAAHLFASVRQYIRTLTGLARWFSPAWPAWAVLTLLVCLTFSCRASALALASLTSRKWDHQPATAIKQVFAYVVIYSYVGIWAFFRRATFNFNKIYLHFIVLA